MPSITSLIRGRSFADAIPDGDAFRLRFHDGYEVKIVWDSSGPVPIGEAFGIITSDRALHPQFNYVSGKVVKCATTDGKTLNIEFTDGHALRSSFVSAPEVQGIDVKVRVDTGATQWRK